MSHQHNRRDFIRLLGTGALSLSFLSANLSNLLAQEEVGAAEPLVWLKGNSAETHSLGLWGLEEYPSFLARYFRRLEAEGEEPQEDQSPPILILEGAFPDDALDRVNQILHAWITRAKVVVLLGNEASYLAEKPGGYLDLNGQILSGAPAPVIRIPGQPAQSRHLLGLLNHLLMYGLPELDEHRRPRMFFEQLVCDRCEYRGDFEKGDYVRYHGEREGCLYLLGCKGRVTYNDCPIVQWNGSDEWCVSVGSPCTGCSEPDYPSHHGQGLFGQLSHRIAGVQSGWVRHAEDLAYGAFGVTLVGLGIHGATKRSARKYQIDDREDES
ncbi:MAG: hypothetical protein RRB13_07725 [bacterium]|nr:hypothetical protein [bacterium]